MVNNYCDTHTSTNNRFKDVVQKLSLLKELYMNINEYMTTKELFKKILDIFI